MNLDVTNKSVLIVDDDQDFREFILDSFTHWGFKCECAINGVDGIEKFSKNPTDLVITDYQMPMMNGSEFISNLKSKNIHLPIILTTGHNSNKFLIEILKYPKVLALQKPFVESVLQRCVEAVFKMPEYNYNYRRDHLRVQIALKAKIGTSDSGTVQNISLNGAFVETNSSLKIGEKVQIAINPKLTLQDIKLVSEVKWSKNDQGYGVQFIQTPENATHALRQIISDELKRAKLDWFIG